jgi:stalled ribosome rescue protein Dom34
MSNHSRALVWVDHHMAKIFQIREGEVHPVVLHSTHPQEHLHHKANAGGSGHAPLDRAFLKRIAAAIAGAGAVLIVGPGLAKTELSTFINETAPELAKRISGVEPIDHPTDGELVASGRSFFRADDRMRAQ